MDATQRNRLRKVLKQAGLPSTLELDENGFPSPGPLVRFFRKKMMYTDNTGAEKHWTQDDLAKQLKLSERSIRLMETENKHLDSIERRWTLATLLKIPPALLGLASLDQLIDTLQGKPDFQNNPTVLKQHYVGNEEILLYRDTLPVLKEAYEQNSLRVPTIEAWIRRIVQNIEYTEKKSQPTVLESLVGYHVLAGRLGSHDLNWTMAIKHFNEAKHVATMLDSTELRAFIHYNIGNMYLLQKDNIRARDSFDAGLNIAQTASYEVKGRLFSYAALAHAMTGDDALSVQKLIDRAGRYVTINSGLMTFDNAKYLRDKADTLISLNQYAKASDMLDNAEDFTIHSKRSNAYLHILRSECYIKQKRPEYEEAVRLLSQILADNKSIQYYVDYVGRLHKIIAASSYGNAPDVVDLGMTLRELRMK